MKTTPRVSICVPVYNGATWLRECLDSALAQTADDFDVVVVDDCSQDGSLGIAQELAARDSRVTVQSNPVRLGLARNWNRCLELAHGEWIKFVFQDDLLHPECLARMTRASDAGMPFIVCDRRLDFHPDCPEGIRRYFAELSSLEDLLDGNDTLSATGVSRILCEHLGLNVFGEPTSVLLHRDVFATYGPFNERMIQLCDLEFWARVGSNTGLVYIPDELVTFRIHEASATAANSSAQLFQKDVLDVLVLFHEFAFSSAFARLREVAGQCDPTVSFSALAARALERSVHDARNSDDPHSQRALDRVVAAHPRLGRRLWRIWHRMRKQFK